MSELILTRRRATDRAFTVAATAAFALAAVPLVLVLGYTVARGIGHLSGRLLSHSMAGVAPTSDGGGIYHAIVGTVEIVGLASVMSVPLGLLAAIYLSEYGRGPLPRVIGLVVDVMSGIPSIVAGLFVYAFLVLGLHQGYSGFAGAIALAILQLPVIIRSAEQMLALVPDTLREAGYALGVAKWRTVLRVVVPTAASGLITSALLAVARVTGETAPLLLTSFGNAFINTDPFHGAQAALPVFIYSSAQQPYPAAVDRAWAAALTLIIGVIALFALARVIAHFSTRTSR